MGSPQRDPNVACFRCGVQWYDERFKSEENVTGLCDACRYGRPA